MSELIRMEVTCAACGATHATASARRGRLERAATTLTKSATRAGWAYDTDWRCPNEKGE